MKHILVIDDEILLCKLIERVALLDNIQVTIARSGEEAIGLLESETVFDAIVLDLILPHISGWEILTLIRNNPFIRDVPVVIMSGCTLSGEETQRLQSKVSAIIHKKKFCVEEMSRILNKLLSPA